MPNLLLPKPETLKPSYPLINRAVPLSRGLVFDSLITKFKAESVFDHAGKARGVVLGATPTVTPNGAGYTFGDTTNIINYTSSSSQNTLTNITIEAYVFPTGVNAGNDSRIIHKGPSTKRFSIGVVASNKLEFAAGWTGPVAGETDWQTDNPLTLNTWNHIVITYDFSSTANVPIFYINGQVATATAINPLPSGSPQPDNTELGVGNRPASGGSTKGFVGTISYVRLWNRALSQSEAYSLLTDKWQIYRPSKIQARLGVIDTTETFALEPKFLHKPVKQSLQYDLRNTLNKGLMIDVLLNGGTASNIGSRNAVFDIRSMRRGGLANNGPAYPIWRMAPFGQVLEFRSIATASSYIEFATNTQTPPSNLENSTFISIEALVYPRTTSPGTIRMIAAKRSGGVGNVRWGIGIANEPNLWSFTFFADFNGSTRARWQSPAFSMKKNQWNHVVAVYDSTNQSFVPLLFINGIQQTVTTATARTGALTADIPQFQIGNEGGGSSPTEWDGYISHVRVWNRLLTPGEVRSLFKDPWQIYQKSLLYTYGRLIRPGVTTTTTTQTESGVSRISATTTQTESAKSRIQITSTQTESGVSRIAIVSTQTENAVSRITASTPQTESGVSRITNTTTQTESGTSRIQITSTQTESAVSRVQTSSTQNESGISRITATTTRTLSGVASIFVPGNNPQRTFNRKPILPRLNLQSPLSRGLVGLWPFTEKSNVLNDYSGNKYNGVLTTSGTTKPVWQSGQYGHELGFDGASQSVIVGSRDSLKISGDITVAVLFSLKTRNTFDFIISKGTGTVANYYIYFSTGGALVAGYYNGSSWTEASYSIDLQNTGNHLVVYTKKGTVASLYLDGVLVATAVGSSTTAFTGNEDLYIGSSQSNDFFNGSVSSTWIWNRALDAGTINNFASDPWQMLRSNRVQYFGKFITGRQTTVTTQTESGTSRIQITSTKTESGTSRITNTTTQTESAVSRITNTSTQTESGVSRVQITSTKTESAISRITSSTTRDESATARIKTTASGSVTGKASISGGTITSSQSIGGKASIASNVLPPSPKIIMVDGHLALKLSKFLYTQL